MKSLWILGLAVLTGAAQAQLLYSNGAAVDSNGLSILENPPNTSFGLGIQIGSNNRVADDFGVTGLGWQVTGLSFFAYQTGATAFSFTSAQWSIVLGDEVNTGTVVASGTSPVTDGGLVGYRVASTALTNTQRPIFRVNVDIPDVTLAPGSYWLTWSLAGSLASGPWQPPTALCCEGNLHQSLAGGPFQLAFDGGSGDTLEAPFEILGVAVIPEPGTYALMLLGLAGVAGWARRRRVD
jgi:hypothetical protein